ncbi:adenylate kinase [Pseudobacteroides cellulosolvens]|uniref:Adenylate kinase n=1 Tax=Pseudobacteroides cellulosolvens ATCC 35603 = DSM 2933 TaxID=398512 RepID=A0A0L6JN65_9FIRM|nr:adenylate kinase [Pseudobacteroides cellulosolvens]KNY27246.1 Adenylate kinase [Pseudobacteroides cellulosolvens ATCC 35603 = DSM 2933]
MRLILLGAPGAGKGTQAKKLSQKLCIPHISTGDIFRNNMMNGTELGIKAKEYIDKGMLVPDELTISIVKDRLIQEDCKNGFILDGFPRTIPQAEYLEKTLIEIGTDMDHVINIHVADEEIIERMSGRRVCPNCGATYHIVFNPTKVDGICDNCKANVIQRDDDKEETVISRLKTYHEQTEPLIDFYSKRGKMLTVIGKEEIEETSKAVIKVLGV